MFNQAFGDLCPALSKDRQIYESFSRDSCDALCELMSKKNKAPFEGFILTTRDERRRFSTRGYLAFDCFIIHLNEVFPDPPPASAAASPGGPGGGDGKGDDDGAHFGSNASASSAGTIPVFKPIASYRETVVAAAMPERVQSPRDREAASRRDRDRTGRRERRRSSRSSVSAQMMTDLNKFSWNEGDVDMLDALSRREDLAHRIMQDIVLSVHSTSESELTIAIGDGFKETFGYTKEDCMDTPYSDFFNEDSQERLRVHRQLERGMKQSLPIVLFQRCMMGGGKVEFIRVVSRMELVEGHCKFNITIPLNDSTHYSGEDLKTSQDLIDMANTGK